MSIARNGLWFATTRWAKKRLPFFLRQYVSYLCVFQPAKGHYVVLPTTTRVQKVTRLYVQRAIGLPKHLIQDFLGTGHPAFYLGMIVGEQNDVLLQSSDLA